MAKALWVEAPNKLIFRDIEERPVTSDEVKIKTIMSGISHGTELNLYSGKTPFKHKKFDLEKRLFFEQSTEDHFYPIQLGYELVGEITEVGTKMDKLKVGDLVHGYLPHQEVVYAKDEGYGLLKLPVGMTAETGMFEALGCVALNATHDAEIKFGDEVGIFGLGVIGLLAIQFARLSGAKKVYASDPIAIRRKLALQFGADEVFNPMTDNVPFIIKEISERNGLDVAIEIAGNYSALNDAIKSVRMSGLVVTSGYFSGDANPLVLSEEWHHNRITMKSSMSVWKNFHRQFPLWDYQRIKHTVLDALASHSLNTDGLISHTIPFEQAQEAYNKIQQDPANTIKVVFTYND